MTRTARKDRKKHLDSSSWTELSSTTLVKEQERDKKFESGKFIYTNTIFCPPFCTAIGV